MKEKQHFPCEAFVHTIPVMTDCLFLDSAFEVFLESKDYGWLWALSMNVFVYADSIQFVTVDLLVGVASLIGVAIMTLIVNARHLLYGIAMSDESCEIGRKKPYMISSLTDETFMLFRALKEPPGPDRKRLLLYIILLDQLYWMLGDAVGLVFGLIWHILSEGIDLVTTTLLTVIFLDRWKARTDHTASILGIVISVLCLLMLDPSGLVIPTILSIIAVFLLLHGRLEKREGMQ